MELSIQLRANREDLSLPDTHGQIWTELALLAEQDAEWYLPSAGEGSYGAPNRVKKGITKSMEAQLVQKLGLTGNTSFPVRRLGTLWRNEVWRRMITEWCQFPLGLTTFNITTWEWMSSCRIDDVSLLSPSTINLEHHPLPNTYTVPVLVCHLSCRDSHSPDSTRATFLRVVCC